MAGKHSSLWDHMAWVYLLPDEIRALERRGSGLRWTSGTIGLVEAVRSGAWGRLAWERRVRLVVTGAVLMPVCVVAMVGFVVGALVHEFGGLFLWCGAAGLAAALAWAALEWTGHAWLLRERRAMRLRRVRTRFLRNRSGGGDAACEAAERVEFAGRALHWYGVLTRAALAQERANFNRLDRIAMVWGLLPVLVGMAPIVALSWGAWGPPTRPRPMPPVLGWLPLAAIGLGLLVTGRRFRRARRRLVRALEEKVCPDCGYELGPIGPEDERLRRNWPGPERCTECGSPWPLWPPPDTNLQRELRNAIKRAAAMEAGAERAAHDVPEPDGTHHLDHPRYPLTPRPAPRPPTAAPCPGRSSAAGPRG